MERILVYGVRKETKEIYTAHLAPEKLSKQEVHDKIFETNAHNPDIFYYYMVITDDIADIISFLKNNRTLDIERHIKAIQDLERQMRCIQSDLDETLYELKNQLKKQE